MKINKKIIVIIVYFIAFFLINLLVFALSAIFTEIKFLQILLYSLINGIWMTFILPLLLKKLNDKANKKDDKYGFINKIKKAKK